MDFLKSENCTYKSCSQVPCEQRLLLPFFKLTNNWGRYGFKTDEKSNFDEIWDFLSVLNQYLPQIFIDLKNDKSKRCLHGPYEQLLLATFFDLSKSKNSSYLVDSKSLTTVTQDDTADMKEILVADSLLCSKVSY